MVIQSCKNCKTQLANDDKFCPNCGTPLSQIPKNYKTCKICNHQNPLTASFCEKCGAQLTNLKAKQREPKTIQSRGKYSGKMTKGKTSRGWKIFRNIIIGIILIGIVALIIWFQVDPEAGKKLTDTLMGIGFMAVLFFVGWLFTREKKGKRNDDYGWDDDQYADIVNEDDFDD